MVELERKKFYNNLSIQLKKLDKEEQITPKYAEQSKL